MICMMNKNFKKLKMKITILLVFCINYSWAREVDHCFVDETNPYHWFDTKTAYRYVSNGRIESPQVPNCKPLQIWMFARHATRYSQKSEIKRFKKLPETRDKIVSYHEDEGRGRLCNEDIENLKRWMPLPNASLFTPDVATEGWREGHELGKIYKDAFPSLLALSSEEINSENYVFHARRKKRAEHSMYAFMEGLFGSKTLVEPAPFLKPNYVLRPDKNCPMWSDSVPNSHYLEFYKFITGPDYEEMRMNVSRRLGFNVTTKEIRIVQDMCRYETAWIRNYKSPWCGIFSEEEWKLLEYMEDLRNYYGSSNYGFEAHNLLSCFIVQDLLESFRKIENGGTKGEPKAIFYFSNSRLMLSLLSALGIGKDSQNLLADNRKQLENRKWRTSFLGPFFSNLLATFYRCNDSNSLNKVTFHLQERLVMLEGCENGICDWDYLKMKFSKPPGQCIKDCDYEKTILTTMNCVVLLIISISLIILAVVVRRFFVKRLKESSRRDSTNTDC